ncbi:MAG: alanine racemase, partial [Oscillospiraceae bacterium]|nr:alanine racemase [Oscillospiraceae bacterium]
PATDYYGVATLQEASELRLAGTAKDILLFGRLPLHRIRDAVKYAVTISVFSLQYAKELDAVLDKIGAALFIHIEIDTGLNRTGFCYRDSLADLCKGEVEEVFKLKHLHVKGIYTHFACAGGGDKPDARFAEIQFRLFSQLCSQLTVDGYDVGIRHCCSSDFILQDPQWHLDMVRAGMLVFGQCSSEADRIRNGFLPALTWRAQIMEMKQVDANESVGYDRTFQTRRKTTIAVISAGYADGYRRTYSNKARVLIHGEFAPVIGKVCMDSILVDITNLSHVRIGDWATLLGEDGDNAISPNELAQYESVNGEVTAAISKRVKRVYIP